PFPTRRSSDLLAFTPPQPPTITKRWPCCLIFSKSSKVSSPAQREISIPRATWRAEAFSVPDVGKTLAEDPEAGPGAGSASAPNTTHKESQVPTQNGIKGTSVQVVESAYRPNDIH